MFSIKESVKYGWRKTREHLGLALLSTLFLLAVGFLVGDDKMSLRNILLSLAVAVFSIIIKVGYTKIFLRINDGESPKFADIFQEYKTFWRYLGVSILTPLAVLGGLILLIIPGIIWAVRFSFAPIIVIDTKMGPIASMKESYAITKGSFWKILSFWIIIALLNLLGMICLGIGLLVTIPVSTLASICIYRELSRLKASLIQTTSPQTV